MEKIARISFVALEGDAPSGLELDPLPPSNDVFQRIGRAFAPFLSPDAIIETIRAPAAPTSPDPGSGLHLIYVYGHAWLSGDLATVSSLGVQGSVVEGASALLARLVPPVTADSTVLVLDCCHAGIFDRAWTPPLIAPRLTIYASGPDEKAIALNADRGTRLSLAIAGALSKTPAAVDLAQMTATVSARLAADGVIAGQAVSYRMNGPAIRLERGTAAKASSRERTVALVRNSLIAAGAIMALLLTYGGWLYWGHALVDIDLKGLPAAARDIRLTASEETPATNGSRIFAQQPVVGEQMRLWIPAQDVIIRFAARYPDGQDRGLALHLNLAPGFSPGSKRLSLALPPAAEVLAHPGMAYVPVTPWYHGRDRDPQQGHKAFWIDLVPPTVSQYLPHAEALLQAGQLKAEQSFLLTALQREGAIDAVGLGQIRTLNSDLGDVFGVIAQANNQTVSAPADIVVGAGKRPCPDCPALMTRYEAKIYCTSQHKRLPTDLEWELAVRGVDGRDYPWGNRFDASRANVAGLPKKGDPPPTLKPVAAYPNEKSPYGLIDTVGNAGDWVDSGGYERSYMGATYRFNPEDATAFRELPVTDDDYLVQEITARCAVTASR